MNDAAHLIKVLNAFGVAFLTSILITEPRVAWIETMLMHKRRLMEVGVDFALICACFVIAHALRFEGTLTPYLEGLILQSLPWIIAVKMSCFFSCRLYRGVWRYISLPDLVNILQAVVASSVLSALVVLYLWRFEGYSRAVLVIDWLLTFFAVGGSRVVERFVASATESHCNL